MTTMNLNLNGTKIIENVKRRAKKIKKEQGVAHHVALDQAAVEFGHANYQSLILSSNEH